MGSSSISSGQWSLAVSSTSATSRSPAIQPSTPSLSTIGSTFVTVSSSQSLKILTSTSSVVGSSSYSKSHALNSSEQSSSSTFLSSPISMPTPTSALLNFTNSLPFSCNSTYLPQSNNTCASIAMNNLISIHQL